jgi:hypothetical protein
VLAALRRQEDKACTQAFASATTKQGHWEATICTSLTQYEKYLAEYDTCSSAYNASKASQDTTAVEVAECAEALAKLASANRRCRKLAECAAVLVEAALVEAALAEYNAQKRVSWDTVAVEAAEHATALAPTMPPSASPMAVLSFPPCPTSYVDAVLSNMGGTPHATPLAVTPLALPSPTADGLFRTVRQCA